MTAAAFEIYTTKFSEAEWLSALETVVPEIHEVDRNATEIWFRFYPLALFNYLKETEDREQAIRAFAIQGDFELTDQIDTSHSFLYGHRFWPEVKAAIEARAGEFNDNSIDLPGEMRKIAATAAEKAKTDVSLTLGIAAVGLMTLAQVGLEAFKAAKGTIEKPSGVMAKSADAIVKERAKDDSQGIFGFLKTVDKKFTLAYSDARSAGKFQVINEEEIASASARDKSKDWRALDERCWEGVVPVECRSASCGTCWVGILGGQDKLSDVALRELRAMKVFGYNQPDDPKPYLRLACQAKAFGNATIVIPPWNGVFGKKVYGVEDVELEPVTTSAKKLREAVASAMSSDSD